MLIRGPSRKRPADPSVGDIDPTRPLGVYVHFPFCSVHCPYCDFAVDVRADIPHDAYADAVIAEVAQRAPWFASDTAGERLRSIYFGGGTPGLWRVDALGRVIDAVTAAFGGAGDLEITVEANPGEVTASSLDGLRAAGVNRLSLGVQSFDDAALAGIGRNHDGHASSNAFSAARTAGFERITCDLMFGLPGQSMADWDHALATMLSLAPDHLSAYALTIERGTRFGALDRAGKLVRPDDDLVAAMFSRTHEFLTAAGHEHYEISSYARSGRRAVHNQIYWTGGAYLGVGASAASFRPLTDGAGWRFTNPRATDTYLRAVTAGAGSPQPASVEHRTQADLGREALWLALRTSDGVDRAQHARRFGRDPLEEPACAEAGRFCAAAGWLNIDPHTLRLTPAGMLFADDVAARLWD